MDYPTGGVVVAAISLTKVHSGRWAVPYRSSTSPPSTTVLYLFMVSALHATDLFPCPSRTPVGQSVSPPVAAASVVRYVLRATVGRGVLFSCSSTLLQIFSLPKFHPIQMSTFSNRSSSTLLQLLNIK